MVTYVQVPGTALMIPPLVFIPHLDSILGIDLITQLIVKFATYMVLLIADIINWLLRFVISAIDLVIKIVSSVINFVLFLVAIPYWIDQQINWLFHVILTGIYSSLHQVFLWLQWLVHSSPNLFSTVGTFSATQATHLLDWVI